MANTSQRQPDTSGMSVWQLLALYLLAKHRKKQDEIADTVQNGVIRSWRVLDFENLDRTQVPWVEAAMPSIRYGYERSQQATISFLSDYRQAALYESGVTAPDRPRIVTASRASSATPRLGADRVNHVAAAPFDERRAAVGLLSTGPATVKRAVPAPKDVAMAKGLRAAAGSAVQQAMNGGRGVATSETQNDPVAKGFQRICDGDPCYFCALLASRGPVYKQGVFEESDKAFNPNAAFVATGEPDGIAKVHDHCRCQLVPVYTRFEQIDRWGKVSLQLWDSLTNNKRGLSPKENLNTYRRAYDNLKKSGPDVEADVPDEVVLAAVEKALETLDRNDVSARFLRSQAASLSAA